MLRDHILGVREILTSLRASEYIAYSVGLLFVWRVYVLLRMFRNRPMGMPVTSKSPSVGRFILNIRFIREAPQMILHSYRELGARTFAIPALTEYQVLACSKEDIKAVCESPEETLSFHAAMTDRLKHKYTMFGFEHNDVDPHNAVPARTLKVLLRMHLPQLRQAIQTRIVEGFGFHLDTCTRSSDGWGRVWAFALCRSITKRVNTEVFLGIELANTPSFIDSANRYSRDAILAAEICRQLPSLFTPVVATLIMTWSGAMERVASSIRTVVKTRLAEKVDDFPIASKHLDCLQWVIDSSRTSAQKTEDRLVQQVGAIFFASSHQMPMALVYAIYSLCIHPEYIELLRNEIADMFAQHEDDPLSHLHLMDAFLRESARFNPLDALSIQRKVLTPFHLPSGALIPPGNLVSVPQQAILMDSKIYPNATHFNPYRYIHQDFNTKFADINIGFPFWGSPRKPCPGRWYVSETFKLALIHLVTKYEFKLETENAPRSFFWTTAMVPRLRTMILMRERTDR